MADNEKQESSNTCTHELGPPHEAISFVLTYLPVFELVVMSQVCKSLRDAVEDDILPWLNIIVDKPLNKRLSDDLLIKIASKGNGGLRSIASKGNGGLRSLALVNCAKISDDVLELITTNNPHIEKLFVPGCTRLTPNGVIQAVKMLPRLKFLKINGIYNTTKDDLETLHRLIGEDKTQHKQCKNMHHNYRSETNRSIDVDICPKCSEIRMVFDCPRESCRISCRGCIHCIPRCEECGFCIKYDDEVGDAACEDTLCLSCWLQLPKCSFCNKPYCRKHADQKVDYPGPKAFLCVPCHVEFIENSS